MPAPSPLERFLAKVDAPPDLLSCWEWRGARSRTGYGVFHAGPGLALAHRFAFEQLVGPVADGLDLDHLCRNRGCVRPEHLEPCTRAENLRRGRVARRVASSQGAGRATGTRKAEA